MKFLSILLLGLCVLSSSASATGVLLGSGETALANPSSKVILATHKGHHVLTLMPGIAKGDDLVWLIPVPATVKRDDVRVVDAGIFDALDALSAPRLTEVADTNPCTGEKVADGKTISSALQNRSLDNDYDISVLSAEDSAQLLTWLSKNNYKLPERAERLVIPYTKKGMAFIVAKSRVKTDEAAYLHPIQIAYDAPAATLPLRLSLINAPAIKQTSMKEMVGKTYEKQDIDLFNDGGQDLTILVLTANGRAISPNMRSIPLNNGRMDYTLPSFVKDDFTNIANRIIHFRAKAESNALITEYAGTADVPDSALTAAGVTWLGEKQEALQIADQNPASENLIGGMLLPDATKMMAKRMPKAVPLNGKPYLTRLYMRYLPNTLPQDLTLQESADRNAVVTAYQTSIPWTPDADPKKNCEGATYYLHSLELGNSNANELLTRLTGVKADSLRKK